MTVAVVGSANLDLVYRVGRLPGGGETVLARGYSEHAGGKGNNQVIAAARAGANTCFIAAIGDDSHGDLLSATLTSARVDQLVRRIAEPTGTALITVDDAGENSIVVNPGANAALVDLTAAECAAIADADYLLMQLEIPLRTVVAAAAIAHESNTTVVLNAAPMQALPTELTRNVDILIVNEHEALLCAAQLAPANVLPRAISVDGARDILAILLSAVPAVVVTLGAAGAVVLTRELGDAPAAHVPAMPVTTVDTTGAGDTFCGALVAELDAGADLIDAAAFASAAAALAVQQAGAVSSIPTRERILALQAAPIQEP
ncbi:ribokinase [Rathayibacter soli]|uniref:ribokinase n=1 Tax=Rathayibacter soli TaxID=3144168 RepID=UPI0027E4AF1B|nr:ribokinase [Glaciibacter superstes]